ncbi:hypothetical protein L1987_39688 [Smallanthus sonchifolius]|uniref:Uncharacterized protein n=1 Tax=Smallanthus sonchifolius TaxID=185202 RepID=A0ACB9HPG4_9ASTR|nr:hypothetical protein L1987_39688 [Smallanthus sonchifolius]
MLPSVVKVILICLYASLCLCCIEATVNILRNSSVPAVMAFGDSFMDSGNNNFRETLVKADFPPYGKDFVGGKPTGRFSNGKTLADYIVEKLGVKDYLPAYLDPSLQDEDMVTGVSFASAGSGFDPLTAKLLNVFSSRDEIEMFKEYIVKLKRIVGEEEANDITAKSLYLVSWSFNDWAISYTAIPIRRIQYDEAAYANLLVEKATEFIQEMYKLGARKMVFFNTPILGCFPIARTVGGGVFRKCGDKFSEEAQTFNTKLNRQIQYLGSTLPQSRFTIVDYFKIVQDIVDHSLQYGLEVVDRGCCGTGAVEVAVLCNKLSPICPDDSKYLFWDSIHLTDKGYNIVVDHALQDVMNTVI